MPDQNGNVTAAELREKLERKRAHRDRIRGERRKAQDVYRELRVRLRKAGRRARRLAADEKAQNTAIARMLRRLRGLQAPKGASAAVRWGISKVGVTESPSGSNWGPEIGEWTQYTGYSGPVYWCGCFVCYAVCKIGEAAIPTRVRLGYHLYIVDDARNGQNGLRAVPVVEAKKGDIVAFDFAHIALVREDYNGSGYLKTAEGNTSDGSGGSQNNGGGVYLRERSVSDVLVIARPDY